MLDFILILFHIIKVQESQEIEAFNEAVGTCSPIYWLRPHPPQGAIVNASLGLPSSRKVNGPFVGGESNILKALSIIISLF